MVWHLRPEAACKSKPAGKRLCVPTHVQFGQASFVCITRTQAPHPIALPAVLVLGVVSVSEPAGMSLYGRHARAVSDRDRWPLFWK